MTVVVSKCRWWLLLVNSQTHLLPFLEQKMCVRVSVYLLADQICRLFSRSILATFVNFSVYWIAIKAVLSQPYRKAVNHIYLSDTETNPCESKMARLVCEKSLAGWKRWSSSKRGCYLIIQHTKVDTIQLNRSADDGQRQTLLTGKSEF